MLRWRHWQMRQTCPWSSCWQCMAWLLMRTHIRGQTAQLLAAHRTPQKVGAAAPGSVGSWLLVHHPLLLCSACHLCF